MFEEEPLDSGSQSALEFIKKLGYQDFEIEDLGDKYLVDGDILFAKNVNPSFSIFDEGRKLNNMERIITLDIIFNQI